MTEDAFPPTAGNHIAIDVTRSQGADLPDTWSPIASAQPPAKSNVAEVTSVGADGRCDATIVCNCASNCASGEKDGKAATMGHGGARRPRPTIKCGFGGKCGAGAVVTALAPAQRQTVCSGCLQANLPHATPRLRCSGCDGLLADGASYRRAPPVGDSHVDVALCEGCHGKLFSRYHDERKEVLDELEDEAAKLEPGSFVKLRWQPEDEREFDDFVCCTACGNWFHFVCAMYPAPEQCPRGWKLENQLFVCRHCAPSDAPPPKGKLAAQRSKLVSLQTRRAADLPTCALSEVIEAHVAGELRSKGVETAASSPLVVRVVSRKRFIFPAEPALKERYGAAYAHEFPYLSNAILVFQQIGGYDVLLFAMYVQEYDADCPPPNTNRCYISYVDSVPYLDTSPPGARTPAYHGVLSGYLKYAASCGFTHCHLWVAPPEGHREYVFHARPSDGRPPMGKDVLRVWYERMLAKAQASKIVRKVETLQEHVSNLQSVRDFPLFEGDFFPARMEDVVEEGKKVFRHPPKPSPTKQPAAEGKKPPAKGGRPGLVKTETLEIASAMQKEVSGASYSFLVATLNTASTPRQVGREKQIGSKELVDDRERFLELCVARHWQFDELRRAQWSTMMLLALVGGEPE